ncbi:MAG: carboxypeptidase-like regulatory domain-containing protein [Gemmatimonadales bacterium]
MRADDITVVAALTEVLLGAGVDVALGADGNAILMKRGAAIVRFARPDIIRGRVTTDSAHAVVDAQIIVTRAPDRAEYRSTTDSGGRYQIVVDSGTGDYLVHISVPAQPTWPAFRKRVTRSSPTDTVFTVDALLRAPVAAAQQMTTVTVQARKPTPTRGSDQGIGPGVGASEQQAVGVSALLAPDLKGDINGTALTLPGVMPSGTGYSVLGVSPGQNGATLNGMAFGGASVPRAANTSTTFTTSTYDPSRGWFAGGQTQTTMQAGGLFSSRRAQLSVDAPALQAGDPVAAKIGNEFTKLIGSLGGDGMAVHDKVAYSYGLDVTHQSSALSTLASLDPEVLQSFGVSRDSVAKLLQLMNAAKIPVSAGGVPSAHESNSVSFISRLNSPEHDPNTFQQNPKSVGLILAGSRKQDDAMQLSPLSAPARGSQSTNTFGMVQGLFSKFVTKDVLQDLRSSISWNEQDGSPYLLLPSANVRVGSTLPDGTSGIQSLLFGGSSPASTSKTVTWETQSETKFYMPGSPKHRLKVNADLRYDATSTVPNTNSDGTFSYNSLSDLAANTPVSFTRSLNDPTRNGAEWNGYASMSDWYRASPALQLLYGVRLEGNDFSERPPYNAAVDAAFGTRTDFAPNTVGLSPRLGFNWQYTKKPNGANGAMGMMVNQLGQFVFPQVGMISGGVGEFRSMMSPSLLSNASVNTGLPNGFRQLSCIGSAIPAPDWNAYLTSSSAIPSDCAGGTPSASLRDTAPAVQLFDRGYNAPRSWRGNLKWTASHGKLLWTVEGLASYNVNQSGITDLNFSNVPRFTLSDEGRPVYVQPSSIVASSGAASPLDARGNQAFGSVISNRSDLRSQAQQLVVTLSPDLNGPAQGPFFASVAYTLSNIRELQRGFDGSTFGSPEDRAWSRSGLDVRHMFTIQTGVDSRYAAVTLVASIRSGSPFTPMVGGDVNGDGLANDRAFIFNPATAADPQLAADTRALLANATPAVRRCLTSQFGSGAARNSCEGPWTADLRAAVSLNTYALGGVWRKFDNVSLYISNPLGGLDQLLHGNKLQGWGNPAYPNSTLYYVRGFDATNQRFLYTVNPRFGDTRAANNAFTQVPFRVTLYVTMRYGPSQGAQQLDRWIRPGRDGTPGPKMSAADLKRRYARNVPDPYRDVLQQSDSLLLTTDQVRAVTELQKSFAVRIDSVWADLADWLAALPDDYNLKTTLARQEATIDAAWEMARVDVHVNLPKVLSPIQLRLLPGWSASFYNSPTLKGVRVFSFASPN